jgi:hypothetical protein
LLSLSLSSEVSSRFRDKAIDRMRAEVAGSDLEEEDSDCPICFDRASHPRVI